MPPHPSTVPQHLNRVGRAGPIAATGSVNCLLTISQIQGFISGTRTIQKSQQRGQGKQGAMMNTGCLQHSSEQVWVHESELRWGSWAMIRGCGWMSQVRLARIIKFCWLLWRGVLHGLQVDICSIMDLHGLQGDSLPHHGLHHGLALQKKHSAY